jgi:hypothetical protein
LIGYGFKTMNYRRGFQRVYAMLAAVWIAAVLFVIPPDRFKVWSVELESPEEFLNFQRDHPTRNMLFFLLVDNFPNPHYSSKVEKSAWLATTLLLPPVFGYFLLFYVGPWIFRGFRSETHI